MAHPQVVTIALTDNVTAGDSLFHGITFWIAQRCPTRSIFVSAVKKNGGQLTAQEKLADIKIVDHMRKDNPPDTYSYTWIEQSVAKGELQEKEGHRAGPPVGTIRRVGELRPAKSGRVAFSAEDDVVVSRWVTDYERRGGMSGGNVIFQELERQNKKHPWQAWRDRWHKYVKHSPPTSTSVHGTPLTPPSDNQGKSLTSTHPIQSTNVTEDVTPTRYIVSTSTARPAAHGGPEDPSDRSHPLKVTKSQFDVQLYEPSVIEDACYGEGGDAGQAFPRRMGTDTATTRWESFSNGEIPPVDIDGERKKELEEIIQDDHAALIKSRMTPPSIILKHSPSVSIIEDVGQSSSKKIIASSATTGITSPLIQEAHPPLISNYSQDPSSASISYYSSPKYSSPVVLLSSPCGDVPSTSTGVAPISHGIATPGNPDNVCITEDVRADGSGSPAESVLPAPMSEKSASPKRKWESNEDRSSGSPELSDHTTKRQRLLSPSFQPAEIAETPVARSLSSSSDTAGNLLPLHSQTTAEIVDFMEVEGETQSTEWHDLDDDEEGQLDKKSEFRNGISAHADRGVGTVTGPNGRGASQGELEVEERRRINAGDAKFGIYEDAELEPSEDEQENILPEGHGHQQDSNTHSVEALQVFSSHPVDFHLVSPEACWSNSPCAEANDQEEMLVEVSSGTHQATDTDGDENNGSVETPGESTEELGIQDILEFDTQIPDLSMPLPPDASDADNESEEALSANDTVHPHRDLRQQVADAHNALPSDSQLIEPAIARPNCDALDIDGGVDFDKINAMEKELENKRGIPNPNREASNIEMPTPRDEGDGEVESDEDDEAEFNATLAQYQKFCEKPRTFNRTTQGLNHDTSTPSDNNAEEGSRAPARRRITPNLDTQAILASNTQTPDLTIPTPNDAITTHDPPYELHSSPPTMPSTARKPPRNAISPSPNSLLPQPIEPSDPCDAIDNFITRSTMLGHSLANVFEAIERTTLNTGRAQLVLDALSRGQGVPGNVRGVWTKEMDEVLLQSNAVAMARLEQWHGKEEFMARSRLLEEMM